MDRKTLIRDFGGALALVAATYFLTDYLQGNKDAEDVAKASAIANHPSIVKLEDLANRMELTQVRLEANQTQIAQKVNELLAVGLRQ